TSPHDNTACHLPTPIPSLHFTPYLSFISSSPGEDSQNKLPFARIRCPKVSMAYVSYCYALFIAPRTWMHADLSMTCQKRPSGHLVSVLSGPEGTFVASLAKNSLKLLSDVWIGLHDPTEPNASGWEWSNPATISNPGYCGSLSKSTGKKQKRSLLPSLFPPLIPHFWVWFSENPPGLEL
uniref:C-type lectin domain-containing protein n=1 Tax=Phocoena sinus TaxID=42100 RepID=A0A8C9CNU5_PHOSS